MLRLLHKRHKKDSAATPQKRKKKKKRTKVTAISVEYIKQKDFPKHITGSRIKKEVSKETIDLQMIQIKTEQP